MMKCVIINSGTKAMTSLLSQQAGHGFGFRYATLMLFHIVYRMATLNTGQPAWTERLIRIYSLGMAIRPISCKMFIF